MDLAAGLVELDDFEAGHLLRILEVGIERLIADVLRGGGRRRHVAHQDDHRRRSGRDHEDKGLYESRAWEVPGYRSSIISCSPSPFADGDGVTLLPKGEGSSVYLNRDFATPSRSLTRRTTNTPIATTSGKIGGSSTAHSL